MFRAKMFSMEKKRLQGISSVHTNTYREAAKKTELDSV